MSYAMDYVDQRVAAEASADARAAFIRKTYAHLAGAILAFVGLEAVLQSMVTDEVLVSLFAGRASWLIVMVAFMGVSYLANYWAQSTVSRPLQYAGLGLYVVAEAVIFVPILYIASRVAPDIVPKAGALTLAMFGGLTVVVFFTRTDFSFLRSFLCVASFIALGLCVVSMFMGFTLGGVFSAAMIALASGYILYYTSNIIHHYRTDQYVAASLALFASVALLFWYIVRIFTSSRN